MPAAILFVQVFIERVVVPCWQRFARSVQDFFEGDGTPFVAGLVAGFILGSGLVAYLSVS